MTSGEYVDEIQSILLIQVGLTKQFFLSQLQSMAGLQKMPLISSRSANYSEDWPGVSMLCCIKVLFLFWVSVLETVRSKKGSKQTQFVLIVACVTGCKECGVTVSRPWLIIAGVFRRNSGRQQTVCINSVYLHSLLVRCVTSAD